MKHRPTAARPLNNPEVVINLWAYSGEDGTILRLAGKTYVMQGTDAEKLSLLRHLAASDFLCAPWHKVPVNFTIKHVDFGEMRGAAQASMISDPQYHEHLFGPLIEKLAQAIPEQVRSVNGEYQKFRLDFPQEPLCVSTIVLEYEDGTLVPMVSGLARLGSAGDEQLTIDCMCREQAGPAPRIHLNRFQALHPDGRHLVRGWFEKAHAAMTADDECFEAFIFAWFAVNGWAACVTGKDRDADYIRALQRSAELAEKFQTLLDGNPQFQSAAADFQRFWPIFKAQDIRRAGHRAPAAAGRPAVVQHYFDCDLRVFEPQCWKSHTDAGEDVPLDWPHALATIYRVRCNLFHGEKSAHSEMDREIVRTALVVLVMFFRHSQIL